MPPGFWALQTGLALRRGSESWRIRLRGSGYTRLQKSFTPLPFRASSRLHRLYQPLKFLKNRFFLCCLWYLLFHLLVAAAGRAGFNPWLFPIFFTKGRLYRAVNVVRATSEAIYLHCRLFGINFGWTSIFHRVFLSSQRSACVLSVLVQDLS